MKKLFIVLLTLGMTSAYASDGSLICDNQNGGKVYITVSVDGKDAVVFIGKFAVETKTSKIAPLIKNKIANMNNVVIQDDQSTLTFKVDGQDVSGNIRLGITLSSGGRTQILNSCIPYTEPGASI